MLFFKLAYKFLFPKGRGKTFYSLSKIFTIGSIGISAGAFLIVLSVFRGYFDSLASRYKDVYSDLIVTNTALEEDIKSKLESEYEDKIKQISYTGYMELLLSNKAKIHGVAIEFMDNPYFLNKMKKYLKEGKLSDLFKKRRIILTSRIAKLLNLHLGDSVELIFVGKNTKSHSSKYKICAIVEYGIYNLDNRFAYISKNSVENDFPSGIYDASVKIEFKNTVNKKKLIEDFKKEYSPVYIAKTWKDINYGSIESAHFDRLVIMIILAILIAIASFNVVVTLVLSMRYSEEDLSILWILGLKNKEIRKILIIEGIIISVLSILLSICIWFIFYLILKSFMSFSLPYGVYLMQKIPIYIGYKEVLFSSALVFIFVLIVSYISSHLWKKKAVLKAFKG